MKMRRLTGFTMVEIAIVLVIVSLLAAFAYPSYLSQVRKSRRADASIVIESMAQEQERFFSRFRTYTSVVAAPQSCTGAACGLGQLDNMSRNDYYTVTSAGDGTSFTLTATARGTQVDDDDCQSMSMNNVGVRSSLDSSGGDSTDECW